MGRRLVLGCLVALGSLGFLGDGEPSEPKATPTVHAGSWSATPDDSVPFPVALDPGTAKATGTKVAEFLTQAEIEEDLDQFQTELEERFAYLRFNQPDAYDYQGPIVFLMDRKCWSASDVILSSVKGLPDVTLIGEPSIGASGARIITTLENSGLDLYLSSMASFQNTGLLFETNGVDPDILLEPQPDYYLQNGADRVLRYAIQLLLHPRRGNGRV